MAFELRHTPLYAESWNVAFRRKPQGSILTDRETPFEVIPNNIRYWAADPMIFTHEGETVLFAELYDYVLRRGVIGVSRYLDNGRFSSWTPILRESFHMSYPYVFRSGDQIFMIPETTARKALLVYRAVQFPMRWELHKVIREDVLWADTSIASDGGGFFGTTQSYNSGEECTLNIRLDKNLEVSEVCRIGDIVPATGRPGGRPFLLDDTRYWIFQDCREDYGKALFFRSENGCEYHLKPEDLTFSRRIFLNGMHTYSATEEFEVIDIKTRRLNPVNLLFRLVGKLRK